MELDSDRAGERAAVFRYDAGCTVGDAVAVRSDDPRIERFDDTERIEPDYRATWYAPCSRGAAGRGTSTSSRGHRQPWRSRSTNAVRWISRDLLNADIADTFVDAEL